MSDILNACQTIVSAIWSMMDNNILPGLSLKTVFIGIWLMLILAEVFRVLVFSHISDDLDD